MKTVHLIHQVFDPEAITHVSVGDNRIVWNTCRRSLGFDWSGQTKSNSVIGPNARQLLLEIVCGLQSPILGETEVHGQYKQFLEENKRQIPSDIYGELFSVHLQAREIRDRYLRGLGTQSYGSFARKKLRGQSEIIIWGSGHLAMKVLPWLSKSEATVRVWVRSLEKSLHLKEKFPLIHLEEFEKVNNAPSGALVLAAPVESQVVAEIIDRHSWAPGVVLDFRAESRKDPLPAEYESMGLEEIFSEIRNVKAKMNERILQAQSEIARLVQESGQYENRNRSPKE